MKISTTTERSCTTFGYKEGIRILHEGGFNYLDMSLYQMRNDYDVLTTANYREVAKEIKEYANSLGVTFVQAHAPFPTQLKDYPGFSADMTKKAMQSLEVAGILGAEFVVVHPVAQAQVPGDESQKEYNLKMYRSMLPIAKEYGFKICIENMWNYDGKRKSFMKNVCSDAESLVEYHDALDDENITICLDIGHIALVGDDPAQAIRTIGRDRLGTLHVHDVDYFTDSHTLPYYGKLNWASISKALGDINYTGNINFEADNFLKGLPADEQVFKSAIGLMYSVGEHIAKNTGLYK